DYFPFRGFAATVIQISLVVRRRFREGRNLEYPVAKLDDERLESHLLIVFYRQRLAVCRFARASMQMLHERKFQGMRARRDPRSLKSALQYAKLNRRVQEVLERYRHQPDEPLSPASGSPIGRHAKPPGALSLRPTCGCQGSRHVVRRSRLDPSRASRLASIRGKCAARHSLF